MLINDYNLRWLSIKCAKAQHYVILLFLMLISSFIVKSSDLGSSNKDFIIVIKSSHHIPERLKVKLITFKNSLKFSKFYLMLLIFRCKTEN